MSPSYMLHKKGSLIKMQRAVSDEAANGTDSTRCALFSSGNIAVLTFTFKLSYFYICVSNNTLFLT